MLMIPLPQKLRWYQHLVRRIAATRGSAWLFSLVAHRLDTPILRLTSGRNSATTFFSGLPVFNLTTIGARSGKKRSLPLTGLQDGDKVVLIASNMGGSRHPNWYHNLRANHEATITNTGESNIFTAHQAEGEERERYWLAAVEFFAGYADYAHMTGGREIPIMVLTPIDSSAA
ncbi:MAG: nitroreductase family deazaflavin-dependent oxidoreductase [Chloroflexi bacterium]|nr:nitroreductase family deazaflavin-dependent oxidoreductase [Chloroflexota bacterium]